jgi:hypothetical protein
MQWDADGGFSAAEPWLPYGDTRVNVAAQQDDPDSLLSLYRRLLRARREFALEGYETLAADGALVYRRGEFVVALNLGGEVAGVEIAGEVTVATDVDREGVRLRGETRLAPGEGVVVRAGQGASSRRSRAWASAIDATSSSETDSFAAWMRAWSASCAPHSTNAASG